MNGLRPPLTAPSVFADRQLRGEQKVLPPFLIIQEGGISMTELEYQEHIRHTHNAYCKIVIRHAAIDIALRLRKQWEKELSLGYLMFEKFVPLSTTDEYFKEPEPCEEYPFTVCGQTVILYDGELAAALSLLPKQAQEEIFQYYFQRRTQTEISAQYGQTRSTAGRHIQLALQQLRREIEGHSHER